MIKKENTIQPTRNETTISQCKAMRHNSDPLDLEEQMETVEDMKSKSMKYTYFCDVCDYVSQRPANLRRHMKAKHNQANRYIIIFFLCEDTLHNAVNNNIW